MAPRHFLDIDRVDGGVLRRIIDMARTMKKAGKHVPAKMRPERIADLVLMLIFEKPSTRTRVSFDVAMRQLGGQTIALNHTDLQIGRGEPISDTAKVVSRYVDAIMIRAIKHATLTELAEHATVPVINGLTDRTHPCQIVADIMTFEERLGPIKGRKIAWSGDGNNVAASWIQAAGRLGFSISLACPGQLRPAREVLEWAKKEGADVEVTDNPEEAVAGADCVVTDTWVSMGQSEETRKRKQLLAPYAVDEKLMKKAKPKAIFMHCLPAYRGNEVSAAVIDGPQSAVWDEAENRLHVQKAILAWCLGVD